MKYGTCSFIVVSRGALQFVDQRVEPSGLGLDQPELAEEIAEPLQDMRAPYAPGRIDVRADEPTQMLQMVFHALERDAQDVDQLVVVAIDEIALGVEHVRESTGHPRTEIEAGRSEHDDDATGHVFAAVIASTFDDRERA